MQNNNNNFFKNKKNQEMLGNIKKKNQGMVG